MAITYTGPTTITIAPQNIATSSTWVAGVESSEIDNTTNKFVDAWVEGLWTVGTSPTAGTEARCYVWGSHTSLVTTARDVLDGASSAETMTSPGVRDSFLRLGGWAIVDTTTTDRAYPIGPFSVRAALNLLVLPQFWGIFIAHNTAVNSNSTSGNHVWKYTGVTF